MAQPTRYFLRSGVPRKRSSSPLPPVFLVGHHAEELRNMEYGEDGMLDTDLPGRVGSGCRLLQTRWLPLLVWEEEGCAPTLVRQQGREVKCSFDSDPDSLTLDLPVWTGSSAEGRRQPCSEHSTLARASSSGDLSRVQDGHLNPTDCCSFFLSHSLGLSVRGTAGWSMCCVFSPSVMFDFFVTPWTVACQASLSMGILQARILEWVAMPSSRGSSDPGIKHRSPALQDSLLSKPLE